MSFIVVDKTIKEIHQIEFPIIVCLFNTYFVKFNNTLHRCADIESSLILFFLKCQEFKLTINNLTDLDEYEQKIRRLLEFDFINTLLYFDQNLSIFDDMKSEQKKKRVITHKGLIF
jgi:hypothetical protein